MSIVVRIKVERNVQVVDVNGIGNEIMRPFKNVVFLHQKDSEW